MAQRKILLPWNSQPQETALLDGTNPINDRVAFAWRSWRPEMPDVGLALTPTNAARAAAQDGVVSRLTAGYWSRANYAPVVTSNGSGGGDFTAVVRANPTASATQQLMVSQRYSAGSFNQFSIIANSTGGGSSYSGAIEYLTFAGTLVGATHSGRVDGRFHTWAIRRVGLVVSFWEDGIQLGSTTGGSIENIIGAASGYAIGANKDGAFPASCDFSCQWSSNRGLSDREMADITGNPWIVYEPQAIWVPVSAGGGGSTLLPSSISSLEAFGTASISVGTVTVAVSSIASSEAFGTHVISNGSLILVPTGISSAEAFGAASLQAGTIIVTPSGIASAEAFGTGAVLVGELVIYPNGISSAELFGIPTLTGGTPSTATSVFYVRGFSSFGFRRNN